MKTYAICTVFTMVKLIDLAFILSNNVKSHQEFQTSRQLGNVF